jgi:thiol-disulfide isomerase/thioredoxin
MKNTYIILISLIISIAFIACDKVDEPYKEDVVKPETNKKVLLEDYTGHYCPNCPAAHDISNELLDIYEENLIVVVIHAGEFFAGPKPPDYSYDFRTPAGEEYLTNFIGTAGFPIGMTDRINEGGNYLVDKDDWGTKVNQLLKEEAQISIGITTDLQSTKVSGEISIEFLSNITKQTSVQIWITEDTIIKPQKVPASQGGIIEDYVHNHVLRGAINGTWGEELPSATYSEGDKETISFTNYQLGDDWVAKQLAVIAFVYDNESKKVIQVEKKKIIE